MLRPDKEALLAVRSLDFLYGRDGLLLSVHAGGGSRLDHQRVIALARALRPAPLA